MGKEASRSLALACQASRPRLFPSLPHTIASYFAPWLPSQIGLNWPQFNHFALFPVGVDNTLYAQFDLLALLVPDSPTSHHRSVQYRILPTTLWRVGGCYQDSWLRRVSGFAKGTAIFLGHCSSEQ